MIRGARARLASVLVAVTLPGAMVFAAESAARVAPAPPVETRVGPPQGTLLIVGGGSMAKLWPVFIELAGGNDAPLVVIPTANETIDPDDRSAVALRSLGVSNVTQLHTRDRGVADTEAFVSSLRTARGVWFTGGRQWRLADAYLHTRTHREIVALLARGGVVGGSSAGASIQASYLVRGAPAGNTIMMAPGHEEGFALLRGTAVDQHVDTRKRAEDLRPVLRQHPDLLGIALDEATAIIVRGDGCEVVGAGIVRFFPSPDAPAEVLLAGARFNLAARLRLP